MGGLVFFVGDHWRSSWDKYESKGGNVKAMWKDTWVFIHSVWWNVAHSGGHNRHEVPQIMADGGTKMSEWMRS